MNVLFLISNHHWTRKMSRCRIHKLEALGRRDDVDLRVWGAGFDGYSDRETVQTNIERHYEKWRPDLVHVYKPADHRDVRGVKAAVSIDYQEAWWPNNRAVTEVTFCDADLVVHAHENDAGKFDMLRGGHTVISHMPHCAERSIYEPAALPWSERDTACLLTGVVGNEFYPFRVRLQKLIESGQMRGRVRKHPGYELANKHALDIQERDYAADLGRSKIVVTCASKYRYALAKIVEAMMAGAVVACDMPEDAAFRNTLGRFIIPLDPSQPDAVLANEIRWLLNKPASLEARARNGQQAALEHFTMEHWAERFASLATGVISN